MSRISLLLVAIRRYNAYHLLVINPTVSSKSQQRSGEYEYQVMGISNYYAVLA